MNIAIATDGRDVSAHFGRCSEYTVVTVENGELQERFTLQNPGHEPGRLPAYLKENGVDRIVAGGMGRRAQQLFEQMDISWILGVVGSVDETINRILDGTICEGESLCSPGHHHDAGCEH
jgi:predicted Fe-Mo cluster-binding NifX family protein